MKKVLKWIGILIGGFFALIIVLAIIGASLGGGKQTPQASTAPQASTSVPVASVATAGPMATVVPPTAQAKASPTVAPTATPKPATPTPAPKFASFGEGQKIVGKDIEPGTYRTTKANPGCYWARLSGFGGSLAEVLANDNASGPTVVAIVSSDKGFESRRCGTWTADLSPIRQDPGSPLQGDGTFLVNDDIYPGLWRTEGGSGCYWARLRDFGGAMSGIIANANPRGTANVQIAPTDQGFKTNRCGTWTRVQ